MPDNRGIVVSGFAGSGGVGAGALGVAGKLLIPASERQDFGAAAGPHSVSSAAIQQVFFENQAAITVLNWPDVVHKRDTVWYSYQGDKVSSPTNPATRRQAADITAPGVVEIYISGVTGRLVTAWLVKGAD